MTRRFLGLTPALLLCAAPVRAGDAFVLPDAAARARTEAIIAQLEGQIRTSNSATLTLESWCAANHMADPPRVIVRKGRGSAQEANARERKLLQVSAGEPLVYRRVLLTCGDHILSEAENWYVPSRLTAGMNEALKGSEPFGKVVQPLVPKRHMLRSLRQWRPLDTGSWDIGHCSQPIFFNEALVVDAKDAPLALVTESYRLELLCAAEKAGAAAEPAGARAFTETVLARVRGGETLLLPDTLKTLVTPRLLKAFEKDRAHGAIHVLDHDPFCLCQDDEGLHVELVDVSGTGAQATATVRIWQVNGGPTFDGLYRMVLTPIDGQWRIADFAERGRASLLAALEATPMKRPLPAARGRTGKRLSRTAS